MTAFRQAQGGFVATIRTTSVALAIAALAACGGGGGGGTAAPAAGNGGAGAPVATGPSASGTGTTGTGSSGGATSTPGTASSPAASGTTAGVFQSGDFQVNTNTPGSQFGANVARLANGGYVTVWNSSLGEFGPSDVRMQRFDAQGQPAGTEQVVVAEGSSAQVAAFADGRFLVTWRVSPFAGEVDGRGRMFDAQGAPLGGTIALGTSPNGFTPRPMALPDGSFIAAIDISGGGKFGPSYGLVAHFAADGTPLGEPTRLESQLSVQTGAFSPNAAGQAQVALLADGRIAAVWVASGTDVSELRLSRFDAQAQPVGAPVVLDNRTGTIQSPSIAVLADGRYAISWVVGAAGQSQVAELELFDAGGASLGRQELATAPAGATLVPRLTALADGSLAAAWSVTTLESAQGNRQLAARRFDRSGAPIGAVQQFEASSWTADNFPFDSLALAPTTGSGFLVIYGRWTAGQSWDVRANVR